MTNSYTNSYTDDASINPARYSLLAANTTATAAVRFSRIDIRGLSVNLFGPKVPETLKFRNLKVPYNQILPLKKIILLNMLWP